MLEKLWIEIKKKVKENLKLIIIFFTTFFLITFELPFYIKKTGGLIDISSRIESENEFKYDGSINMAYVTEIKATLPTMMIAKMNSKWDIVSIDKNKGTNETEEEAYFRNRKSLDESINNAIVLAFNKANKEVKINNKKLYVTYIFEEADTNLKVGDVIESINNIPVENKKDVNNIINSLTKDDVINIKVSNNGKKYTRTAKIIDFEGINIIGIMVVEDYDIKTNPTISFKFDKSESGASGGLMMSLAIYSKITDLDITRGRIIAGTGTIDIDGKVGEIDGVKYKLAGAVKNKADIFIVPNGNNYKDAMNEKEKNNYEIDIVGVDTFDEALEYLKN